MRNRATIPTVQYPPATPRVTHLLSAMVQAHAAVILICAWTTISVFHKQAPKWSLEAAVRMKLGKARSVRSTVPMVIICLSNPENCSIDALVMV